ncbi:MAG: hypothetical protein JSR86_21535 [Proteobacteria bacterium]|nr:hypothetical protein [Pseudomonadota bacterium]
MRVLAPALAAVLSACASAAAGGAGLISDAELQAYAAKPFDKSAMMFKHLALGRNHGAPVVVDFPCGDVCPAYTVRIIHYDVAPGPACAAVGGIEQKIMVPRGIAVSSETFCVPRALGDVHP